MPRMRGSVRVLCATLITLNFAVNPVATSKAASSGLSVARMVEARRLLPITLGQGGLSISPNGEKYLFVVEQANLKENGYWIEFWTGNLTSLSAARPHRIARLFSTALIERNGIFPVVHPSSFHLQWLSDNLRLRFLWTDGRRPTSLLEINVATGAMRTLISAKTSIEYFAMSDDGSSIRYSTYPPETRCRRSGPITTSTLLSLLETGCVDGDDPWNHTRHRIWMKGSDRPLRRDPHAFSYWVPTHSFSPDGKFAIVPREPTDMFDPIWGSYADRTFDQAVIQNGADPHGGWLQVAALVNFKNGTERLLPMLANPISQKLKAIWAPDSQGVAIGPTFMPPAFGQGSPLGDAIVYFEPKGGRMVLLPLPLTSTAPELLQWDKEGLYVKFDNVIFRYSRNQDGYWNYQRGPLPSQERVSPPLSIHVAQSAIVPPTVEVKDSQSKVIIRFPIDPSFPADKLGSVRIISWVDTSKHVWHGRLYLPANYNAKIRYPLVLQTHGFAPESTFSLSGTDDATFGTTFAAEPLAEAGIVVLQIEDAPEKVRGAVSGLHVGGYDAAVRYLDKVGIIDKSRVGIAGFSRTGWYVEDAIAFGNISFAAAIVADNANFSYIEAAAMVGDPASLAPEIGGDIVGKGLGAWLTNSATFSAERIKTPLRIELDREGPVAAMGPWDLFARMRRAHLPVEMTLIENASKGSHPLMNPKMRLESEQGAFDWFRYWLQDYQDPDPNKANQYKRWHALRVERDAARKTTMPPRLLWKAFQR